MTEKELLELKQSIEKKKEMLIEKKGSLNNMTSEFKKEFDCTTIKEGKVLLKRMEKDIQELEDKISEACNEIEEKFEL